MGSAFFPIRPSIEPWDITASKLIDEFEIQMVPGADGRRSRTPSKSLKKLVLQEYSCGCGGSQPLIPTVLYIVAA
jgi:hypothetical protein